MANRESQGLQIALILFVMVSVVLAVMTFVFYRSGQEAKKTAEDARQNQKVAQDSLSLENFKVQYLKHILGAATLADAELAAVQRTIAADEQMQAIDATYMQDMATYGEGLPREKMNYRELPGYLIMSLRNKNVDNAELAAEVARLNQEKARLEEAERNRTEVAQTGLQQAKQEQLQERNKFKEDWQQINSQKDQVLASYQKDRNELESKLGMANQRQTEQTAQMEKMNDTIQKQLNRISELVDEPFESPDGRVTWVNQSSRTVWINLGLADGLRRQTTFSVYDQDAMNVAPRRSAVEEGGAVRMADEAKGKIEITRVVDQHLAEGRIVEDQPANPILPGDQVFSPAWKPGQRVRFALVGIMDIDDDRRSDRELVRNIITMGGGIVDAEVHDDGSIEGELSASTRYLVRGRTPMERRALDGFSRMLGDAERLGIQEISLPMLLDLMGYKNEVRTVELGTGRAGGQRVPPTSNGGNADESSFRERRPPAANGSSAF